MGGEAGTGNSINVRKEGFMDKEKLNKAIILRRMLDEHLNVVSRVLDISSGDLGDSLKAIVRNDKEFRAKFMQLVHETYNRLQKEFDEL